MSTWIDRLQAEHDELQVRLNKLDDFIYNNARFAETTSTQQRWMRMQAGQMRALLLTLRHRLAEAEAPAAPPDDMLARACGHLVDVMKNDDGQAWKEAARFLKQLGIEAPE